MFAVRSFGWLLYIENDQFKIQSPNNLGDLALHITYLRNFALGVPLWPENPIYLLSSVRYPAGIDLFNALLFLIHIDLRLGLTWVGLLASAATFYAFWRWGGAFGIAGFLFNGGLAGFADPANTSLDRLPNRAQHRVEKYSAGDVRNAAGLTLRNPRGYPSPLSMAREILPGQGG